jgi:citrate lyase beta subunit
MTPSAPSPVRPRRSLLFVPALRPDRFARALEAGADIVCIDMEDAVAIDRKDEGRAVTLPLFRERTHPEVEQMVRINALSTYHGLKDLQALIESDAPPPAIMIPKIRSAEEVQIIDGLLSAGRARDIRFCVIIETNQGLERAIEIAKASPRIDSMILGAVDMSADLRCVKAWEPLLYARSRLVHAAASAGIDLLDVPFLNLDDPEGLAAEAAVLLVWLARKRDLDRVPDQHRPPDHCALELIERFARSGRGGRAGGAGGRGRAAPPPSWQACCSGSPGARGKPLTHPPTPLHVAPRMNPRANPPKRAPRHPIRSVPVISRDCDSYDMIGMWFQGAPPESIKRGNVRDLLAFGFGYRTP